MEEDHNPMRNSITLAKEFILNHQNEALIEDEGKSGLFGLGKSRNYKLTAKINSNTSSVTRGYSDFRMMFKKICTEFPFLILPHMFSKKEDPKGDQRLNNMRSFYSEIIKYNEIVSSPYFEAFMNPSLKKDELWNKLSSPYFTQSIFKKWKKDCKNYDLLKLSLDDPREKSVNSLIYKSEEYSSLFKESIPSYNSVIERYKSSKPKITNELSRLIEEIDYLYNGFDRSVKRYMYIMTETFRNSNGNEAITPIFIKTFIDQYLNELSKFYIDMTEKKYERLSSILLELCGE